MRKPLALVGRVLAALFMLAWWTVGVVLLFGASLLVIPFVLLGAFMAWKAADGDRYWS